MANERSSLGKLVATALISGAVASTIVGALFTGYVTRVEDELRSRREWKEQSVAELFGPINMPLIRSKKAFERWSAKNLYLEAKVIKIANETVRDLLLEKGHLIPPDLMEEAAMLIEHYDVWLEVFERLRAGSEPDLESSFTFAGPEGYPFPRKAEAAFRERYREYWRDLYRSA